MGEKAFCKYEEPISHQQIDIHAYLLMVSFCKQQNVLLNGTTAILRRLYWEQSYAFL